MSCLIQQVPRKAPRQPHRSSAAVEASDFPSNRKPTIAGALKTLLRR